MTLTNKLNGFKAVWKFDNRWSLILNKIFFSSDTLHIYRYKNLEFLNDHSAGDANGARDVIFSPMYLQLLRKMDLPAELSVLDLGANNGGFPMMLAAAGFGLRKLVSVELNPETCSRLRFNLERNFKGRAAAVNAAVCGDDRWIDISLGSGSTSDNIYEAEGKGSHGTNHRLPGRTFDSIYGEFFAEEVVDICKIDVEGAEFEIFNGKGDLRLSQSRYLLIEIHAHPDSNPSDLVDYICKRKFRLVEGPTDESVYLFANLELK